MEFHVEPGYEMVAEILQQALDQTQKGKGKERHASANPFEEQKIMHGARTCGLGGMSFQVYKKATEAQRMAEEGNFTGAYEDLKGAIIYAAAQYLRTIEMEEDNVKNNSQEEKSKKKRRCPICKDGERMFINDFNIIACPQCGRTNIDK